ncbi:MAG TPA: universal stress protein [Nitrospira sp.]|nr:universal stress protein [Nitrospira sp.]
MSVSSDDGAVLQQVFHPSDFSPASERAFAHALKAALIAKADLTILHVAKKEQREWTEFPGVRATLERWGLLPTHSSTADVSKLGIGVRKIQAIHDDPVESVTAYLSSHNTDLIVLATDQSKEKVLWFNKSIAAPIARKSHQMTLFVPKGIDGFVSINDGSISLHNILIPVAAVPSAEPAVQAAVRMAQRLHCQAGIYTLLHVGDQDSMPDILPPQVTGWKWKRLVRSGEVIDVIHETALEIKADLIVMTTDGRHGFLDALRGSHSERLLRRTPCPLLTIPAHSFMASVI